MVDDYFMAPADDLLRNYIRSRRDLGDGLTDERFIRLGITRALEGDESGRAFLQAFADQPGQILRGLAVFAFFLDASPTLLIPLNAKWYESEAGGR